MDRQDEIGRAIRQRDAGAVVRLIFAGDPPTVRSGFRTETEVWDFKRDCPRIGKRWHNAWAELAKDVLAFHNKRGGLLIFGITDDFLFTGATTRLDSKLVNDQLRRYLGDRIWVEYHREFIQANQRYLGIALIPPRGPSLERFKADAPSQGDQPSFLANGSAIRDGDTTRTLSPAQADELARSLAVPSIAKVYEVDEPFFRVLNPDYVQFVYRDGPCAEVEAALSDPRSTIASIVGIGGVGKTALATWAVLRAYERGDFEFIVSLTAKDRELTSTGIQALEPTLTSFEKLLNDVLEVLQFADMKTEPLAKRERIVRDLLGDSHGLLYIDNLETVDDTRIIQFLETLPPGVRAITTSRRTTVRTSVHPVDLGPLEEQEILAYIKALSFQSGFSYTSDLTASERTQIGKACDGIPLAMRWVLGRSKSSQEALNLAANITRVNQRGEELLEFCFRRVFDAMSGPEQAVLKILSLFQRPMPAEALLVASGLPMFKLLDTTEDLLSDALLQRLFDDNANDYSFKLLPITRAFVYAQVAKDPAFEETTRKKLRDWYEGKDISDPGDRVVIREVRQGRGGAESALLDLAAGAERRGDLKGAQSLYEQALQRNPGSWRAARLFGEFHRHKLGNITAALRLYEQAAANSPRRGPDRALVYREWGMLLRDSGEPQATDRAIDKFEEALSEVPDDVLAIHALAHMRTRKGHWNDVIRLLEPLVDHPRESTRDKAIPLLLDAYKHSGELVKAANLSARLDTAI